jgi:hypothetical protein
VARAEPSIVFSSVGNWDATQVRTDGNDNDPFILENTVFISLLVTKMAHWNCSDLLNFLGLTTSDKDGLSTPLDSDSLTEVNLAKVKISSSQSSGRSRNTQRGNALDNKQSSSRGISKSDSGKHHVSECTPFWFTNFVDAFIVESAIDTSKFVKFWDASGDWNITRSTGKCSERVYLNNKEKGGIVRTSRENVLRDE